MIFTAQQFIFEYHVFWTFIIINIKGAFSLCWIALDVNIRESSIKVYKNMGWLPLHLRRQVHLSSYMYRIINEICPKHFIGKFLYISGGSRNTENCNLYTPKSRSHKEFSYLGAKAWNILQTSLRECDCVKKFSKLYKDWLIEINFCCTYRMNIL